jgi:hypothetical protein
VGHARKGLGNRGRHRLHLLLRGLFPDGVTPGKGHGSVESIVGWTDLALFSLIILSGNFRGGFMFTGMALNCGFKMCVLNPLDQTVFSKNLVINPNGAAVSASSEPAWEVVAPSLPGCFHIPLAGRQLT